MVNLLSRRKRISPVSEFYALRNIHLSIQSGERIGVIGLNGAGKSTLLKMIVGIYPPHCGRIEVRGRVTPMLEIGTGFDVELSGRENIYVNGAILGYSRQEMKVREKSIIEFSELENFIDAPMRTYSSGMWARLGFAVATDVDPNILILDEPTTALDPETRDKFYNLLQMLNREQGVTVILVTHDTASIGTYATRFLYIDKELIFNGTFDEFCHSEEMTNLFGEYAQHLICHRHQ